MREKPQTEATILTMGDQIRARGGILGAGKDGNGNPIPGAVPTVTASEPDREIPPVAVEVGQVWRDETGSTRLVTVLECLEATDGKPARWFCRVQEVGGPVPGESATVERAEGYFRRAGLRLHSVPVELRRPDRMPVEAGGAALSHVASAAADLAEAGRAMTALGRHIAVHLETEPTLQGFAAELRSVAEAHETALRAVNALAGARGALADLLVQQPPAVLAGLVYVLERTQPVTLAEVAGHLNDLLGDHAAQGPSQDFMDALPHLGAMGWLVITPLGEPPHGLNNVTVQATTEAFDWLGVGFEVPCSPADGEG